MEHSKPYVDSTLSKKAQVTLMFDSIADSYDMGNKLLSLRVDRLWRKRLMRLLKPYHPKTILDIATGTADLALQLNVLRPQKIVGIDISPNMIAVGKEKINKKALEHIIDLRIGDGEAIDFPDYTFDAVTIAFGFRNFENRENGLSEMYRVLRRRGVCMILEFSYPTCFWNRWFYTFYLGLIVPYIGGWVSKHRAAYSYLNHSIKTFPSNETVILQLKKAGFTNVQSISLSGGICRIWKGEKI